MSSVYLKCSSWERQISKGSESEGACSKLCSKYEGPILLILSVVFAVLTAMVAYGYIPIGSTNQIFNAGLLAGTGAAMTIFALYVGLVRTLTSQGCLIIRKETDSTEVSS